MSVEACKPGAVDFIDIAVIIAGRDVDPVDFYFILRQR